MEPIISKLQEGVKYPRFERDATTIINDLVEHITKERGVYSSSIEPNPNEHKVWFNTNNNTLNIYENGKWNTISGQGGGTISGGIISGATIDGGYLTGNINATNATISGATISCGYLTGSITASGATIDGATISGGNINVNQIKASGIETPYIRLTSGSDYESIQLIKDNYIFNGKLADSTLFHSIDLNHGSIAGLTSIKTLSYTGLSIEPYDVTGTGTPIIINGRAAGINIIADSTAHLDIECITKLNWIKGSSNGYMMTFNTTNNTINSNYDTFNIANGNIKLTSGLISGNTNVNLTLSGTISGATISGATISGGTITGVINASGATINGGNITGTINASGATISGANIHGATLGAINVTSGSINYAIINNAYIGNNTLTGTINASNGTISGGTISGATISGGTINNITVKSMSLSSDAMISMSTTSKISYGILQHTTIENGSITGFINANGATINGATISGGNINGATISGATIGTGNALLYAGSKVLVTYTGSVANPILIPSGGRIGYDSASLTLCGVTLTGGDFTKLKNLQ